MLVWGLQETMGRKWTYCAVYSIIQMHLVRGKASGCPFLSHWLLQGGNGASVHWKCLVTTAGIDHQRPIVTKVFSYVFKWQLSARCKDLEVIANEHYKQERNGWFVPLLWDIYTHFLPKRVSRVTEKLCFLKMKCSPNGCQSNSGTLKKRFIKPSRLRAPCSTSSLSQIISLLDLTSIAPPNTQIFGSWTYAEF